MYEIVYKPTFVRQYKKLPLELQEEIKFTIQDLALNPKNPRLKTHKLKGKLEGVWSCSVNYAYRMLFEYEKPNTIVLLAVGNHDVYK